MKLSKYLFLFFIISAALSHKGHSHSNHSSNHGTIKGRIIDSTDKTPKKYANISIIKAGTNTITTGVISDNDGLFIIDQVPFGNYFLRVNYIGYKNKTVNGIDIIPPDNIKVNLGDISIDPKVISVKSVIVQEKGASVIEDIEKTTYAVQESARSEGSSANEILEKLPSVSIDIDGNITLRGNPNVTIMIDGRESKISLELLSSNMIEKVEIMTTPSAKYDPDGMAGIINIVLSKNKFLGTSGSLSFNSNFFNKKSFVGFSSNQKKILVNGGQNISGTFNYFKNNFNVFSAYNLNLKKNQKTEEREIEFTNIPSNDSNLYSSKSITNSHPLISNFKVGIERYFNENHLLAFDLTYFDHLKHDTTIVRDINSITTTKKSGNDLNYGLGYFFESKNSQKNFSIEFDYDDHDEGYLSKYDFLSDQIIDFGIDKIFSVNFSAPLLPNQLGSKYEGGLKIIHEDDMHGGQVQEEDFDWTYDNLVSAIYLTLNHTFSNHFSMQFGTRFENQRKVSNIEYNSEFNCNSLIGSDANHGFCDCADNDSDGKWDTCSESLFKDLLSNLGDNLKYTYNHNRLYPSLFLMYKTHASGNIKLSLSRRIERPSHHEVNPIPNLSEIENNWIEQGNPYLDPEDIYLSELTYSRKTSYGFIKASIYANKVFNLIDKDLDTFQNESGKTYTKFTSNNISQSIGRGMDFYYTFSPATNWDLILNGNYWHDVLSGTQLDQNGLESGFWGSINSNTRINSHEIGLYAQFSSTMKIAKGEVKPTMRIDLSYSSKIYKNFNLKVKIQDLLDNSSFKVNTEHLTSFDTDGQSYSTQKMSYLGKRSQRTISINLEYRFGAFQKKRYRREQSSYEAIKNTDVEF